MGYFYKNRSSLTQSLTLEGGRSIHVGPGEEVPLEGEEHTSLEITAKTRGNHPTGSLRNTPEESKSVSPKKDTFGSQEGYVKERS